MTSEKHIQMHSTSAVAIEIAKNHVPMDLNSDYNLFHGFYVRIATALSL